MKKYIIIAFLLLSVGLFGQTNLGKDSLYNYTNTYLNSNGTGAITGLQLNTILLNAIRSHVNNDSATSCRLSSAYDTLFVTYWGRPEDTIEMRISATNDTLFLGGDTLIAGTSSGDIEDGTADGQMAYWDNTAGEWKHTETSELYWHNSNQYFGVNNASPDEVLDVIGNMELTGHLFLGSASNKPHTDTVLVYSNDSIGRQYHGWQAWSPTVTWTGGTPSVTGVYRYKREGSTVHFIIDMEVLNESGSTLTDVSISLPVQVEDINALIPVNGGDDEGDADMSYRSLYWIDAQNNTAALRRIDTQDLSFPNNETWNFYLSGFYECSIEK